jgi:hypothetical protein
MKTIGMVVTRGGPECIGRWDFLVIVDTEGHTRGTS